MANSDHNTAPVTDNAESEIQLNKIFSKAMYHWPLYLLAAGIAILCGLLYLRYTKPVYLSVAKIYIKDENKGIVSGQNNILEAFGGGSKLVENEMEIIKSPILLQDVIRENRFNIRYFERGRLSDFEVYEKRALEINILSDSNEVGNYTFDITRKRNSDITVEYKDEDKNEHVINTRFNQPFTVNKDRFSISYFPKKNEQNIERFTVQVDSIAEMAYAKADELKTGLLNNKASVFVIAYEDVIARRSADFLNAILKKYNEFTLDDKNLTALNSIKFIDSRLQALGSELGTIEKDVETFKTTRGITQIDENSRLFLEQVKEADTKLDEANIQLSVYDQLEKFIGQENSNATITPVIGNVDASLTALINRYQELLSNKKRLSLSLQPTSTLLTNIDQQINDTRKSIRNYITGYRQNAIATRSGMQKKVNQIEGQIANVPKYERQFLNLQRQQSVKNSLYLFLLQKKEETAISYASNIVDNKIISPAFIPKKPMKPQKMVVMIAFILGGLFLASIYLLIKYLSNNYVSLKKDIQQAVTIPIIAEIFKQPSYKINNIFEDTKRSVLKEQMLNLRSNLKFLMNNVSQTPVILFTSSISGEGKSFLSAHLGNSLTGNNKRIVLIELDLRKPKLSKSMGIDNNLGLTNYLLGEVTLERIIKTVPGNDHLFLIPSGPIPPNPVELIENERLGLLIAQLRQQYDYIVIDTAPLGLVADAKSLVPYVDCALFVVRYNYTPKAKLNEVGAAFKQIAFKSAGVIFNGIEQESSYGYYNYGYSSYAYGYGYSDKTQKVGLGSYFKRITSRIF